jgi:signal transduction histidine kinase
VGDADDPVPIGTGRKAPGGKRPTSAPGDAAERILVVDDNADMRRYLRHILQEHWKVETATDGMLALARARKWIPDLVIADLMMPGLDGLSLLGALRDDAACKDVPVMVLSARANEEASIDAFDAGADDYLPKPFSARELTARVAVQLARARLRRAERAAREVAEQSSLMKEELVTMLSNSLRNPLNVMLNTISLLKEQTFGGEEALRALEVIRASTREQHRLIDEVHDVSCITAGCFNMVPGRIASLSAIVNAELDAVRPIAGVKRVRVESFIDSGTGPLDGDAHRLGQVVHNLLAHALACTPAGGNVIVECHGRGDYAELVVRDNGMGIASESIPHLFDPLWQMHHARAEAVRTGGIWLGLAVVHRIVEMHGGRVFASSGGASLGAVFTVRLPLAAAAQLTAGRRDETSAAPARVAGKISARRASTK